MSPGCKMQLLWAGAWERGWGDRVAVPTLPGPMLAEHSGEVFSVTLDLQNFQFLRGIKAPRSVRDGVQHGGMLFQKILFVFQGHK